MREFDLQKHYDDCVYSCQQMGATLAVLEDLLFDESGVECEELDECVIELIRQRDYWKKSYEDLKQN